MKYIIDNINNLQKKNDFPNFNVGDFICVNFKSADKNFKSKSFNFEGLVISKKNFGINCTCTLRNIILGEGVEKTFFLNSLAINSIKIKKRGLVRKSKIYYIRKKRNIKVRENINK